MELIILIVVLGLLFDYTNGFHDAANVVSTVIATRALTPLVAIILAGLLNTLGATHSGGVAETITTGLINSKDASQSMILAAVAGAIGWNIITWYFGVPSSSSYALVGGLVGAAWMGIGEGIILWNGVVGKVLIPMVISPLVGFILSFALMKGLYFFLSRERTEKNERVFRYLQIGSSSLVALAHGLNDAQKSMGIITLGLFAGGFLKTPHIPLWVVLSCALMMGLGTASGGFRIIKTMGFKITKLAPVQGFAAEMSASAVILAASFLGMPISSTHMIVGSITGVGTARRLSAVRWMIAHKLAIAWVLTLPGAGAAAALFYKIFHTIF